MVAVHDQSVGYVVCNTKYIQFSKKPSCKCLLGVYQLWVRVKHRYRGISKQLVDAGLVCSWWFTSTANNLYMEKKITAVEMNDSSTKASICKDILALSGSSVPGT